MIYEHFRAAAAYEAVQGLSDLFSVCLHIDDVQEFHVRWDQALLSVTDMPSDVILEGLYKSKISRLCSASDRLGFVRSRNRSKKWADKLFTIDQMMRTRNFRVWNDVVEEQQSPRVKMGRKPAWRGKWESVFRKDNVKKETHVVSVMTDMYKERKRTIVFSRTKFEGQD